MSTLKKILLVDDDVDLRDALADQLALTGEYGVVESGTGAGGIEIARSMPFDLVILDVGLPDMGGREACRLMRKAGVKCPMIMLSGRESDADTIPSPDSEANDYIAKPFKFAELLARIRAQLRQHEQSENAVFQIQRYSFRPSAKLLVDDMGEKIRLTEKEADILKFLFRAGDGAVAREVLLHEVWGYNASITTHTLETHIYRLRQKIERDPSNAELLLTENGGYRLAR